MLLSLKLNNCMIFNREVEFSMKADMRTKRFQANAAQIGNVHVLKSAVLFGANNTGKTNFVRAIEMMKSIMLNQRCSIMPNLFSDNQIVDADISFTESGREYILEISYDSANGEYISERFSEVHRPKKGKPHNSVLLLRDVREERYESGDSNTRSSSELISAMKMAARNNLLIYLLDTQRFPLLAQIKQVIVSFASRIDIVDMNNIPLQKTIGMMKMSRDDQSLIARFVSDADLYLDDFRYADDDEVRVVLDKSNAEDIKPQEEVLARISSLTDMLHLVSVYRGIAVPSIFFDSTGTKKIAALAGYVIGALKHGRILVVDELDNSLHFRLTRAIIALFNNELNECAQLIATVHDISLLDCRSLFRKEQIWFTHKDDDQVWLYSLSEFTASDSRTRGDSDLMSMYRQGVFGAIPQPDMFETLLEVIGK